jgi:hypothetical protein
MARKRVNGRFVKGAAEETEPEKKPVAVGAPGPRSCRTFAGNRVAEAMPEIMRAMVTRAKKGSVPHFKALLEVSGLNRRAVAPKATQKRGGGQLGRALLEELERNQREAAEREAAGDEAGEGEV